VTAGTSSRPRPCARSIPAAPNSGDRAKRISGGSAQAIDLVGGVVKNILHINRFNGSRHNGEHSRHITLNYL
jgi:hypothetical protein